MIRSAWKGVKKELQWDLFLMSNLRRVKLSMQKVQRQHLLPVLEGLGGNQNPKMSKRLGTRATLPGRGFHPHRAKPKGQCSQTCVITSRPLSPPGPEASRSMLKACYKHVLLLKALKRVKLSVERMAIILSFKSKGFQRPLTEQCLGSSGLKQMQNHSKRFKIHN